MTDVKLQETPRNSLSSDLLNAVRYYLGGRTGLIVVAVAALGLAAYSGWGWLVAAGIAPLLLTLAPCAVMCALGLCIKGGKSKNQNDDVASSLHSGEQSGGKSSLRLMTPPGAKEDASPVSSQPSHEKPGNRKNCC